MESGSVSKLTDVELSNSSSESTVDGERMDGRTSKLEWNWAAIGGG